MDLSFKKRRKQKQKKEKPNQDWAVFRTKFKPVKSITLHPQ